eukprot:2575933-Ditylum_brightwellii.AAC.1
MLAFVVPSAAGEEPLIGFHLALPMGYIESAAFFCCTTKTIADITNTAWHSPAAHTPHPLEHLCWSPPAATANTTTGHTWLRPHQPFTHLYQSLTPLQHAHLLQYINVYMDDFMAFVQGDEHACRRTTRTLFHTIDQVFCPNDAADTDRQEPISLRKLQRGDGTWSTVHKLLGWLIDMVHLHLTLPPAKAHKLAHTLAAFPRSRRRAPRRK